jgi:biopolymer transport protein ExbB
VKCRPVIVLILALAWLAPAQDPLSEALDAARRDVEAATQDLNAFRDAQTAGRTPLADELATLQAEVLRLRRETEQRRAARTRNQQERELLGREAARLREEFQFVHGLLEEYRRSLETHMSMAESAALGPRLEAVDRGLSAGASPSDFAASAEALLRLAEGWNLEKLGGTRYPGTCLDARGTARQGRFATLGPVTYFASEDGETSGLVVSQIGSSRPVLFPNLVPPSAGPIAALVDGREADVPVDVTGGDALRVAARSSGLVEHLRAGGFVMVPLLLIGVLALVFAVWKLLALRAVHRPEEQTLDAIADHLKAGRPDQARALLDSVSTPFAVILSAGIDHYRAPREHLEELMHERALSAITWLDRHLGMLAVLGGVAPLLGLLGTVTGMIHTFEMVTVFGTGDAKLLSGGISEALVTTETGLVIAVPVLLIHAYLSRRAKTIVSALEQTAVGLANRLHAGGEEHHA